MVILSSPDHHSIANFLSSQHQSLWSVWCGFRVETNPIQSRRFPVKIWVTLILMTTIVLPESSMAKAKLQFITVTEVAVHLDIVINALKIELNI